MCAKGCGDIRGHVLLERVDLASSSSLRSNVRAVPGMFQTATDRALFSILSRRLASDALLSSRSSMILPAGTGERVARNDTRQK